MVSYTSDRQRWILLVSVLLLLIAPTGKAIISETVNGYMFTAPDLPDSNTQTRKGAEQWCQKNNSTLAEIYNPQIQQAIVSFINGKSGTGLGNRNIWINGMRTPLSSWTWVNGTNADGINYLPQKDSENVNGYLQNSQNGPSISADKSSMARGYICQGVDSLCNGGFLYNSRCYRAISTPLLSWYDARNECKKSSEGDLASFDFINDVESLRNFNWSWINSSTSYWIGIRSRWWTWQNSNSEIIYTNWSNGHPAQTSDCLQLVASEQWKWGACGCNEENQLICIRDTTSTSASVTPTTNYAQSKSTSNSVTTTSNSSSKVNSAYSGTGSGSLAVPLGVGLGVGIGGLLIVIVLIVIVVLLIKRHRQKRPQTQDTLVNPENTYAKVLGNSGSEMDVNEANADANKIVYSTVHAENP